MNNKKVEILFWALLMLMVILMWITLVLDTHFTTAYIDKLDALDQYANARDSFTQYIQLHPQKYFRYRVTRYAYKLEDSLGVSHSLILAIVATESSYRKEAISSASAYGLMQLQLPTASYYCPGVTPDVLCSDWKLNMRIGTLYLRDCIKRHGYHHGILAYNGGPGILEKRVKGRIVNERYYSTVRSHMNSQN